MEKKQPEKAEKAFERAVKGLCDQIQAEKTLQVPGASSRL